MTHIQDIMDISELERLVAEKYISRVQGHTLTLYNYTEKATYDRLWTAETRSCRGLIVDSTGAIIARPFEKFSNVDEAGFPESALSSLLLRPGPVEITDKLDGSMVAVWHYGGAWHTSTRGSFASTQAITARIWLGDLPLDWTRGFTYLGEWIAPDNRVVLKYDRPEFRLIGVRHPKGYDAPYEELAEWAAHCGVAVVPSITECGLEELAGRRAFTTGVEGWVARWPDGYRVKIKTEDYLRLHRLISGFSAARVREAILTGEAARYIQELPEEIRVEAERIVVELEQTCSARMAGLAATYDRLHPLLSDSRKAYALAVQQESKEDWPFLFSLADGKDITEKVLKAIDLVALFGDEPVVEDV